jgi:hypothetical protein
VRSYVDIPKDQLNTVIHEVMHMVLTIPVTAEAMVVAISGFIQPRRRHRSRTGGGKGPCECYCKLSRVSWSDFFLCGRDHQSEARAIRQMSQIRKGLGSAMRKPHTSVVGWPLYLVDDHNVHEDPRGFQLQAQLLLESTEQIGRSICLA